MIHLVKCLGICIKKMSELDGKTWPRISCIIHWIGGVEISNIDQQVELISQETICNGIGNIPCVVMVFVQEVRIVFVLPEYAFTVDALVEDIIESAFYNWFEDLHDFSAK
jgi:hypothetical protein